MSSGMYASGLNALMNGNVDLVNDQIAVLLVNKGFYSPDLLNDATQADIPDGAFIAEALLLGKAVDGSTFRADALTFNSLQSALPIDALVIIKDTGILDTSILLCYIDDAPEFPVTPTGDDVVINWDTGPNGIFKL